MRVKPGDSRIQSWERKIRPAVEMSLVCDKRVKKRIARVNLNPVKGPLHRNYRGPCCARMKRIKYFFSLKFKESRIFSWKSRKDGDVYFHLLLVIFFLLMTC